MRNTKGLGRLWQASAVAFSIALVLMSGAEAANRTTGDGLAEGRIATFPSAASDIATAIATSDSASTAVQANVALSNDNAVSHAADAALNNAGGAAKASRGEHAISAAQPALAAGTTGARPGWGCGDTSREHTGPPGRPGATPPPGCAAP